MPNIKKYTIRDIHPEAVRQLWLMKIETGSTIGEIVSQAVFNWYGYHFNEHDRSIEKVPAR